MRAIQQAGELKKVQHKLGVPRASLDSLSEANEAFDPDCRILDRSTRKST